MKINLKILSIPPYISTSWKNVVSLHLEGQTLVIGLVNGATIRIPNLDLSSIENVFSAHEKYLELETIGKESPTSSSSPAIFSPGNSALLSFPMQIGIEGEIGNILQHNPDAAGSPDLPREMLEKVASLSKVMGFENEEQLPKPEPHCNCMHCQLMRVMHKNQEDEEDFPLEEDEISDEELRFREWDIEQIEKQLYSISNPLNREEQYNVFLGNPVGCTCGNENCEHIKAVLNS